MLVLDVTSNNIFFFGKAGPRLRPGMKRVWLDLFIRTLLLYELVILLYSIIRLLIKIKMKTVPVKI